VTKIQLYDTTLRDGMQGEGMSLSAEEKLRVAHRLDELGIDLIEAGFPSSNPKEAELFGLLATESFSRPFARWWGRPGAFTWRRWSRSIATRTSA
jgi:2-isopropylmalate synthase